MEIARLATVAGVTLSLCCVVSAQVTIQPVKPMVERNEGVTLQPFDPVDYYRNGLVCNPGSNNVSLFHAVHNFVLSTVPIGASPISAACTPNGRFAFVLGELPNGVARLTRIDWKTKAITGTVDFGSAVSELEVSPDGSVVLAASGTTLYAFDPNDLSMRTTGLGMGARSAEVAFDSASQYAYVASGNGITTLDLSSLAVMHQSVLPLGVTYTDIAALSGVPNIVFGVWAFALDAHATFMPGSATLVGFPFARDLEMFTFGAEHFAAWGGGGATAVLHLRHINSGQTVAFGTPTATAVQGLRFNKNTLEVWGLAPPLLGSDAYVAYDLVSLQQTAMLTGNGRFSIRASVPALSQDGRYFYAAVPSRNEVQVIDTTTKTMMTPMPVGIEPTVVVMQGDASTREAIR